MHAKWTDGLATEVGWAKGGLKEFKMQLHFEVDDEEVGEAAGSGIAPAHADDWQGGGHDEDFAEDGV